MNRLILLLFAGCMNAATYAVAAETTPAQAENKTEPKWEFGIAVGGASLPQYMGSDERYTFGAPIPYFIYRGEHLKVDRGGITSELFGVDNLSLDASLGVALPVRNKNRARAGMPSLKFSLQAGPRLNWRIYESERFNYTLRLPWRAIVDTSGSWLGWVSEPDMKLEYQLNDKLKVELNAGVLYGSKRYMDHYYSVEPIYSTATRPAYQAQRGLHSISTRIGIRYEISDNLTLFTSIRYRNLAPGGVADSPLVRDHDYLSIAGGIAWSFWTSAERVPAD